MHIVRDEQGRHYLLFEQQDEQCRVRNLQSGTTERKPCSDLRPADLADALDRFGAGNTGQSVVSATRDDRGVGLLIELLERGPTSARGLLDRFDVCESDLHGLVSELRAAGFIEPATAHGERGYRATERAYHALGIESRDR